MTPAYDLSSSPALSREAEKTDPLIQSRRIARLDHVANWLDSRFSLFGIRFGLDGLLGLIPVVGDVVMGAVSVWLILEAVGAGARKRTIFRMAVNVLLDTVIGAIPLLGAIFDIAFKANNRNVRLLKKELLRQGSE